MEFTDGIAAVRSAVGPSFLLVRCGPCAAGLERALTYEGIQPHSVAGPAETQKALRQLRPDTVVVGHPDGSGPELVEWIAPRTGDIGAVLLALTPSPDAVAAVRLLAAGADDVVEPPHAASVVLLRSRLARARAAGVGNGAAHAGTLRLDPETREVRSGAGRLNLSGREFDLLHQLTSAEGTAVPRRELMEEIWGRSDGSESVLDATVHRLRKRLEGLGLPEDTIETVWGVGYRLDAERLRASSNGARPSPTHEAR